MFYRKAMGGFTGFLCALGSCVLNGIFPLTNKIDRVARTEINPYIFNLYFVVGVFVSSLGCLFGLLIAEEEIEFTYLGILSGLCIVLAGFFTFTAIPRVGVMIGSGIWCGTAALISFFEGFTKNALTSPEDNGSLYLSLPGVLCLFVGILCVALCEYFAENIFGYYELKDDRKNTDVNSGSSYVILEGDKATDEPNKSNLIIGYIAAVLTGAFGGTIGFPSSFADDGASKIKFLPSFAVGVFFAFPCTFMLLYGQPKEYHFKTCFLPGFIGGCLWNGANILSIYAIDELGYSIAYPIMQSALLVTQVFGVFVFKEIQNFHALCILAFGGILVIGGNVLIGIAGEF